MPPNEPKQSTSGEYYKQISSADPLAGSSTQQSSQFDFMLKDNQKPKRGIRLPLPNLPKPFLIVLGVLLVLVLIIVLSSVLSRSRNASTRNVVEVMARAQEITRVSGLAEPKAQTPETKALAATTQATLASQQQQLQASLGARNVKVDPKDLTVYLDEDMETRFQAAAQNSSLDETYIAYLKKELSSYQSALQKTYGAASAKTRQVLSNASKSVEALLSAPSVNSSSALSN